MLIFKKIFDFFKYKKSCFSLSKRENILKNRPRIGRPIARSVFVHDKSIDYVINDPTTPVLNKKVIPPKYNDQPPIFVKSYRGGGFNKTSEQGQAANCFVTVTNAIEFFNSMSEKPIPKWPGIHTLQVIPRAGVDLNAYYDRRSLRFFYSNDSRTGQVFTCDSADIVAHELGHAILDSFRPETWSVMSLEVASIHEAFADFTAMMSILSHDEVVHHVIQETQGDLFKENVVSRLAEQVGSLIYSLSRDKLGMNPKALRSSINNFKYVNPGTLPTSAPNHELAAECHSFGRIFLGALYDMFVMIYEDFISNGNSKIEAVKNARDISTRYILKAIQNCPINGKFYNGMAKTLLWADVVLNERKYHDRLEKIFCKRNLITTQLKMLNSPKCENENLIIKTNNITSLKLSDVVIKSQSNDNPLYDVEIEIPKDKVFLYDNNRNLYDYFAVSDEDSISCAIDMINYLNNTNSVSDDIRTPFEIKNGKLIRTFIS